MSYSGNGAWRILLRVLLLGSALLFGSGWNYARLGDDVELLSRFSKSESEELLRELHFFRQALKIRFPNLGKGGDRPLRIILCDGVKDFSDLSPIDRPAHFNNGGFSTQTPLHLLIVARRQVDPALMRKLVFHEFIHTLLREHEPLPLFLEEGLAEYCSTIRIEENSLQVGLVHPTYLDRVRAVRWLPPDTMIDAKFGSEVYQDMSKTGMFYAQSWAFIHYTLRASDDEVAALLKECLNYLLTADEGDPRVEEIKGLLARPELWLRAQAYALGEAFSHELIELEDLGPEPVIEVRSAPRDIREAMFAEVQLGSRRFDLAEKRLDKALRKWKDNARLLEGRGLLALYLRNFDAAGLLARESVDQGGEGALLKLIEELEADPPR